MVWQGGPRLGGTIVGTDFFPLGTTDYSATLIKARGANPDVIVDLAAGDDGINSMKQAVQFGLDKQLHIAGMQQELEVLEGLPPEARIGTWLFEWYWNQPKTCRMSPISSPPSASRPAKCRRRAPGSASPRSMAFALAANQAKTLDAVKSATRSKGLKLPPEVA